MDMNKNQLDPALIKLLLEANRDDPELQALMHQMETADALRDRAIAPNTSHNAFGALAQGLAGYGSGKMAKQFPGQLQPIVDRRIGARRGMYEGMFPSGGPSDMEKMAAVQGSSLLGRMTRPDEEDPYMP